MQLSLMILTRVSEFRGRVKVTVHNFVKFVTADVLSESLERIDSVGPADFVDGQTRFRE
jgi:hypothetical protein